MTMLGGGLSSMLARDAGLGAALRSTGTGSATHPARSSTIGTTERRAAEPMEALGRRWRCANGDEPVLSQGLIGVEGEHQIIVDALPAQFALAGVRWHDEVTFSVVT